MEEALIGLLAVLPAMEEPWRDLDRSREGVRLSHADLLALMGSIGEGELEPPRKLRCWDHGEMPPSSLVLIVDDDPELRRFLAGELEAEGYGVETAGTGQQALLRIREGGLNLVVLDWTLPDFSGVEVCQRMRRGGDSTPVLMLTARDDVRERVEALDAGADDYLTKPFSIEELLARVRARLRRLGEATGEAELLRLADLTMNTATREVSRAGQPIQLTVREFALLEVLLRTPNRVHSRQELLDQVWGETFVGDDNVLDVYIRYLRRKIEQRNLPTLIQTVRGVGFMLRQEEPPS